MTIILVLFATAIATMTLARETVIGRWLRQFLIERPAAWLNNAGPIELIALVVVFVVVASAPEIFLFVAADLTLYFELLAATMMVAGQLHVQKIVLRLCKWAQRAATVLVKAGRPVTRRAARAFRKVGRSLRPPTNDPDEWALA